LAWIGRRAGMPHIDHISITNASKKCSPTTLSSASSPPYPPIRD